MVLKVVAVTTGWTVSSLPPTVDTRVVVLPATVTNLVTVTVLVSVIVTVAGLCDNMGLKSSPAKARRWPDRLMLGDSDLEAKRKEKVVNLHAEKIKSLLVEMIVSKGVYGK
jgi:hypothetical protein